MCGKIECEHHATNQPREEVLRKDVVSLQRSRGTKPDLAHAPCRSARRSALETRRLTCGSTSTAGIRHAHVRKTSITVYSSKHSALTKADRSTRRKVQHGDGIAFVCRKRARGRQEFTDHSLTPNPCLKSLSRHGANAFNQVQHISKEQRRTSSASVDLCHLGPAIVCQLLAAIEVQAGAGGLAETYL